MSDNPLKMIQDTQRWIESFVIALNLCPFAAREMSRESVHMQVSSAETARQALEDVMIEAARLDKNESIATSFLLFSSCMQDFWDYLDFIDLCEITLKKAGYEGIYQLATFHPDYCFANTPKDDVSNYTNRAPYPMVHFLREGEVEKAIAFYGDTELIPEHNIQCLQKIGLTQVKKMIGLIHNKE